MMRPSIQSGGRAKPGTAGAVIDLAYKANANSKIPRCAAHCAPRSPPLISSKQGGRRRMVAVRLHVEAIERMSLGETMRRTARSSRRNSLT